MPKDTKAKRKRRIFFIQSKSADLFLHDLIDSKDYDAIKRITKKALNRLK